mmetsp:Transcript_8569/g.24425  ORF Transcript_8569/g.24425 Transcript_8569/m.24425 type:complete len:221 (+) Transcript_8569:1033-1695(+)
MAPEGMPEASCGPFAPAMPHRGQLSQPKVAGQWAGRPISRHRTEHRGEQYQADFGLAPSEDHGGAPRARFEPCPSQPRRPPAVPSIWRGVTRRRVRAEYGRWRPSKCMAPCGQTCRGLRGGGTRPPQGPSGVRTEFQIRKLCDRGGAPCGWKAPSRLWLLRAGLGDRRGQARAPRPPHTPSGETRIWASQKGASWEGRARHALIFVSNTGPGPDPEPKRS